MVRAGVMYTPYEYTFKKFTTIISDKISDLDIKQIFRDVALAKIWNALTKAERSEW